VLPNNTSNLALKPLQLVSELNTLAAYLDGFVVFGLHGTPTERALTFQAAAGRARRLIEHHLSSQAVRQFCLRSESLMTILESALFNSAAGRGVLELGIDWSRYGR
jgi:hypothetical protein